MIQSRVEQDFAAAQTGRGAFLLEPERASRLLVHVKTTEWYIRSIETFELVWTTVRDQHFDKTLNGVDWDAVRVEFEPKVRAAASQDELRGLLSEMLARLDANSPAATMMPSALPLALTASFRIWRGPPATWLPPVSAT